MTTDLSGVFTAIAAEGQQTSQDFAFTWTILNNLNVSTNLSGVYTALNRLQNTVDQDFAFTWTVLNSIKSSSDNSGVYTALDRCCSILEQDFAFTWTMLNNVTAHVDLSGVYTAIAAETQLINQDFAFTWTILNNIKNASDNSGIYTALNRLQNTVDQDFAFTWTILRSQDNAGIYTALNTCCSTLQQDFAFTWTMLNYIEQSMCSPTLITQAMIGTSGYTISTPGEYKIVDSLTFAPGAAADMITITTANVVLDLGCGRLSQINTTASVNAITLNGTNLSDIHIINGHLEDFTGYGVTSADVERLYILNTIMHNCGLGALSLQGTSYVNSVDDCMIENCQFDDCAQNASASAVILITYGENPILRGVQIYEAGGTDHNLNVIDMRNCIAGELKDIHIGGTSAKDEMNLINCKDTSQTGFIEIELRNNNSLGNARGIFLDSSTTCSANAFADCTVQLLTGTAQVQAFSINNNCDNHDFINCAALLCRSTGTGSTAIVYGFAFQNNKNNYLNTCVSTGNTSASTVASPHGAYGFDLNTTYSCSLTDCRARNMSDAVAAPPAGQGAVGFRINNGSRNACYQCISGGNWIGFRLNPSNSTAHTLTQCQSTKNSTNFYQFPAGSYRDLGTIANLNTNNLSPWTNLGLS